MVGVQAHRPGAGPGTDRRGLGIGHLPLRRPRQRGLYVGEGFSCRSVGETECLIEPRNVVGPGPGHVRTTTTTATGRSCDSRIRLPAVHPGGDEIRGSGNKERGLAFGGRSEDDEGTAEFVAESIGHTGEGVGGFDIDAGDHEPVAANIGGRGGEVFGEGGALFTLEPGGLLAQPSSSAAELFDPLLDVGGGDIEPGGEALEAVVLVEEVALEPGRC